MIKFLYKYWKVFIILFLSFHLVLLYKLKFTAWPEMLLWPYLVSQGILPYKEIAIAHTPLLILKLSFFYKLFGVGILQLKIFTWLTILLTDILVFVIANKLWGRKVAVFSTLFYIILMMMYDGNGLWFDLLLAPLALITFYFSATKKYFLAGTLFALMFLTKQTAVWFLIPLVLAMMKGKQSLASQSPGKRSILKENCYRFGFGLTIVFLLLILLLFSFRLLPHFYNWAISFGVFVLPRSSGQIQLPDIKNLIVSLFPFSIFIPLLIIKKMKIKNLAMWTLAGILGAYPRFEYFHFQPGIAFLAFATSIFFVTFNKKDILSKILLPVYIIGSFYLSFSFIVRNYNEGVRFYETGVQEVAEYVKSNTNPGDKIFVLNWWDNIYPLTNTLPATSPWVPQLSWYQEFGGVQAEEVVDLIEAKPELILLQPYTETGLSSYKPHMIYDYIMVNYKVKDTIGNINILVLK